MRLNNKSGIYQIRCLVTGDCYIGSAVYLPARLSNHRGLLCSGKHPNVHLLRAWRKYGEEAFQFVTLLRCNRTFLVFFEQRAMDILKPRYNIEPYAASSLGRVATAETRAKQSLALKGRKLSPAHLAALMGRPVSPETRAKIAIAHLGKPKPLHTQEQRAARSTWQTGRRHTPETIAKMKVAQKGRVVSDATRVKLFQVKRLRHKHATPQAETPPTEPAGRAKTGEAFQA